MVIDNYRTSEVKTTTPVSIIVRITVVAVIRVWAVPGASKMMPSPVIVIERVVVERIVVAVIPVMITGIGVETRAEPAV
jgi:hypothetical protein